MDARRRHAVRGLGVGLPLPGGGTSASGGTDPLYTNLVAFYKMDEVSGDRADSIGAYTLTDNNTVLSTTGLVYATAANFEADTNESLNNATLSLGDTNWAIGLWLNFESLNTHRLLVARWNTTGNQRSFQLRYNSGTSRLRFSVSQDGTNVPISLDNAALGVPSLATWYNTIIYHDATNNLVGIVTNAGTANTTSHTTGVFGGTSNFRIGQDDINTAGVGMDGFMGPVMVWNNYIPDADDRTWLYNAGAGRTLAEMFAL
jgi:hypothetical protein